MLTNPLSWIPDPIKQQILDGTIDFLSEQAKSILGDQFSETIGKLKSDSKFQKEFLAGIDRATEKFIHDFKHEDEDLVEAIISEKDFWKKKSVRTKLLQLLQHPNMATTVKPEVLTEFDDVLPQRVNRVRVERAVAFFLQCLVEEVWHLPELHPIYELRLQRITAEKATEMVGEIKGMRNDVRQAFLQLIQNLDEQRNLLEGDTNGQSHIIYQPKHNLPQPEYGLFVGRENEKKELIKLLRPHPESIYYVMTILGVGGVGKSALALEIAHYYRQRYSDLSVQEKFDAIIWFSAKETVLVEDEIHSRWPVQKKIDDLYSVIAGVLGHDETLKGVASLEEQDQKIRKLLSSQRTLLILDNLETVDDERLLDFILHPPTPTKIIVTTRHWVSVAYPIKLEGMPYNDAKSLIEQQRKIGNVQLSEEETEKLIHLTGGVPLAIVWSIGLIRSGRSPKLVLNLLGNAKSSIAQFIFEASIQQIRNTPAYNILITLALFLDYATDYKVREHVRREELGNLAQISDTDRDEGLALLYQLSLINQNANQFSLLPLTKVFALEELIQHSNDQFFDNLRKRVNSTVFDLSQHTPFIYGTPIPAQRLINRRSEVRLMLGRIARNQSVAIAGEPRSGKTSLLNYLASPEIQAPIFGNDVGKVITVRIDAKSIHSIHAFWSYIIKDIAANNTSPETQELLQHLMQNPVDVFYLERLFDSLAKGDWRVLLFLDEFEIWLANPEINKPEFFGSLRSLASRLSSLQLVISSSASLQQLNQLTRQSSGSPFFNFFTELQLNPFTKADVDALIETSLAESKTKFDNIQYLRQLGGRNWFKSGMNHAQTGNLLENLG